MDGDIEVGKLLRSGTEIHFEIHQEFRHWWITQRSKVNAFFQKLMDEDAILTTRTLHTEPLSLKLIPRLGFTETWRDDNFVYFVLERLPFERKSNEA